MRLGFLKKATFRRFDGWVSFLDPRFVFFISGRALVPVGRVSMVLLLAGFALSLIQGTYGASLLGVLHLPALWLAILLLLVVIFWAVLGLVSGRSMPLVVVQALVPTGGMFSFLSLWSGALWLRAVEGVWWIGDARQVAAMVMLCIYVMMLATPVVFSDSRYAERTVGVIAVGGGVGAIVLFFAVEAWLRWSGVALPILLVDATFNWSMLLVAAGFWFYATYVGLVRLRCLIKEREFGLSETFSPR